MSKLRVATHLDDAELLLHIRNEYPNLDPALSELVSRFEGTSSARRGKPASIAPLKEKPVMSVTNVDGVYGA